MSRPALHLAIPVDDLDAARSFHGSIMGLSEGRSSDRWLDWDFSGNQLVTHLVSSRVEAAEQWTMFFRDPAGNAREFKSFRDESKVFSA